MSPLNSDLFLPAESLELWIFFFKQCRQIVLHGGDRRRFSSFLSSCAGFEIRRFELSGTTVRFCGSRAVQVGPALSELVHSNFFFLVFSKSYFNLSCVIHMLNLKFSQFKLFSLGFSSSDKAGPTCRRNDLLTDISSLCRLFLFHKHPGVLRAISSSGFPLVHTERVKRNVTSA